MPSVFSRPQCVNGNSPSVRIWHALMPVIMLLVFAVSSAISGILNCTAIITSENDDISQLIGGMFTLKILVNSLLCLPVVVVFFISRRIQYDTFDSHNISTISQMYSSSGCQRSLVAHRADNRYCNNDTAVGKQGARGNILFFPDVSSTWHLKYERFNMIESHIYL